MVTVGTLNTVPPGLTILLSSYDPLAWFPAGSCALKQGSIPVQTPYAINVCVDPAMPAGSHIVFLAAAATNVTAYAGLPLNVGTGTVTVDQPTVSLAGSTVTKDI